MAKLITPRREENLTERAQEYIRVHLLFPSAMLGLILLIAGTMALGYQYLADIYGGRTFVYSTALFLLGALAGWGQSRYHRYLLKETPEYFAGRLRAFSSHDRRFKRKEPVMVTVDHPGRKWVPLWYGLATAALLGASSLATASGHVYAVAAYLLPWSGFFCSRIYAWRELWGPARASLR
jgi:hypothetical protein